MLRSIASGVLVSAPSSLCKRRLDSSKLSYSASPNPSLLCQKDQAARFCPSFGTEPYIEFTLNCSGKTNVDFRN
ncbi:hypothetical protein D1609_17590 [Leptospira borgpetersenii serovar Hardjo-bovis]|nr:hypothetical protein B9T54_17695 [Leptospira borgpetersenii serovar Hardjo-bovis]AYR10208.1 hypothetical protein D1609_17590 [Leptospira borgpetersenii serovar Hardjo-bovis]TQE50781.1 hypothetical protein FFZ95_17305 [Leptospira borgpetersenii]TQE51803.1 hypothetical protein FFZ96_17280 [Leptospira borgpetersenii]